MSARKPISSINIQIKYTKEAIISNTRIQLAAILSGGMISRQRRWKFNLMHRKIIFIFENEKRDSLLGR